ncbi:MAG: hypothetical protein ACE5KP_03280 [Dehalococcoidales bacterium]
MIKRIVIVIIGIIVVVLGRGFFFYSGFYTPPPSEITNYENIVVPSAPLVEFSDNVADDVSDNVSEEERSVLIDLAHENNFEVEELNVLMLRLISRGLNIRFMDAEDDPKKELLGEEEEEEESIEEEEIDQEEEPPSEEEINQEEEPLKEEPSEETKKEEGDKEEENDEEEEEEELPPDAFIIVSPQLEFSDEDKDTIEEFVEDGGKLLLIADPTRESNINDISLEFGLIFEPDYLYNMIENEINYRNIFITEFEENEITQNLEKIVLYVAGTISSDEGSLAFVDENTFSSLIESTKQLSPIALVEEEKVLGVHDLTFMTEPYNGVLDNNQLIANIADWLAIPGEKEKEEKPTEKD